MRLAKFFPCTGAADAFAARSIHGGTLRDNSGRSPCKDHGIMVMWKQSGGFTSHTHRYIYIYTHIYIHIYIYVCVYIYICIYIDIDIDIYNLFYTWIVY